ncbi:urease accessory protein UreE [Georhizobium sp. MAB10]|uniref:urease accessory protein UreE n=1 Tax=Georhizobium sp. MAB10 TaxID=3028319 RepID=UPI00385570A7
MERASSVLKKGAWSGEAQDSVTLDETARNRRRLRLASDGGVEFLLDLPHAVLLRDGDGLQLTDGAVIVVRSKPEELYEVRAQEPSAQALLRLAWHIGNRHLASQIFDDRILIRRDHVIRQMLEGLGAVVTEVSAPFDPEGGAYDGAETGQDHHHGHHEHGSGHGHSHSHDRHHHDHDHH